MIDVRTASPAQIVHLTRLRVATEAVLENARVALNAVAVSPLLDAAAAVDPALVERVMDQLAAGVAALRAAENATKDLANARWSQTRPAARDRQSDDQPAR